MVAETLYTFTAADITSVVIECTACGHGIVIGHLEIPARQPGALRCPGCEREWWLMRGGWNPRSLWPGHGGRATASASRRREAPVSAPA